MLQTIDQRLQRKSTTPEPAAPPVASAPAATPVAAATVVHREPIVIRVTKAGHTIIEGKRLTVEQLDALFKAAFADADPTLSLFSDEPLSALDGDDDVLA